MKSKLTLLALFCCAFSVLAAPVPPAEKLLPPDAFFFATIPDAAKWRTILTDSPQVQLWRDDAMRPFKEKFLAKLRSEVLAPLERKLNLKLSDYEEIAQGQVTLAVVPNTPATPIPGWVVLVDAKDKSDQLKKLLGDARKRWTDSGGQSKSEKIRDLEFTTLITSGDEISKSLEKILPGSKSKNAEPDAATDKSKAEKIEITIGQSDSLLVIGQPVKFLESIIARQSGASAPALSDESSYQATHNAVFRDANAYAWLNTKALIELALRSGPEKKAGDEGPSMSKIFGALGVTSLKYAALSFRQTESGALGQFVLGLPESTRAGFFKALTLQAKDAGPPAFVPADTVNFNRTRMDLQKVWAGFESTLNDAVPAAAGGLKLVFDNVGKDKDPDFDLRRDLIGNLGDDVINYQKAPRSSSLADLAAAPSIYLISSQNADKLANAFKVALGFVAQQQGATVKEREFLGRKVYSLPQPSPTPGDAKEGEHNLSFAASGGYVALSTDAALLEEYLRSTESKAKSLRESPGFTEAAEKVGGMNLGLFGYANDAESMRVVWDLLKKNSDAPESLFLGGAFAGLASDEIKKFKEWVDLSLLPPFSAVSKYFYFNVYSGGFNASGFTIKAFGPRPPGLKK
jgi:hypothetical protein